MATYTGRANRFLQLREKSHNRRLNPAEEAQLANLKRVLSEAGFNTGGTSDSISRFAAIADHADKVKHYISLCKKPQSAQDAQIVSNLRKELLRLGISNPEYNELAKKLDILERATRGNNGKKVRQSSSRSRTIRSRRHRSTSATAHIKA